MLHVRWSMVLLCLLVLCVAAATARAADDVQFNRDVRPILTDNCFHCHGPDPGTRKAGLRFDRKESLLGKTKDGSATVIVPGKPDESELYKRIVTKDEDDVMPPSDAHKELTAAQKDLLKRWIEQGAPWQQHWSFIAPVKAPLPSVKDAKWVRNPIDAFVLAKLEANGLNPAPEADRRALIRRLSLDLTGLPPEPADVEAFLKDASPNAYKTLVDKYLASPHYGEHRARYWLDAARYADTHGIHFDNYREIWPFRDWVINAYNRNEPFDQFTKDQLAGDLIPNHTLDQRVASGFMRCGMTTNEGGTIAEENLVFYAQDRTETAAHVWLGLTMNCCVCHDHKFDPVSQKDFYSMSAFFNNITMAALDGNVKDTAPSIIVPRMEDRAEWDRANAQVATLKKQLADRRAVAKGDFDKWLASGAGAKEAIAATPIKDLRVHASLSDGTGKSATFMVDGEPRQVPLAESAKWQPGHVAGQALQTDKSAAAEIADVGDFERDQPFTCAVWAKLPPGVPTGSVVSRMEDKNNYRGWDLWIEGGRVASHVINTWPGDAMKVTTNAPIDLNQWHHLCVTYDGSSKAAGLHIYVDGQLQATSPSADKLRHTIRTKTSFKIGSRQTGALMTGLLTQDLRLYGRALPAHEVRQLITGTRLAGLLVKASRTEAEQKEVFDLWLGSLDVPSMQIAGQITGLDQQVAAITSRGAATLVMQEKPTPPVAYVLYRGAYDQRRDKVTAATPGALPPMPKGDPDNRIAFADWLVRPDHPLTSRVAVNRLWQEIFGTGIVRTADDFGVMGEPPSHPELLDWLAVDFRENGWDIKRLVKQIVMSSTYRQTAQVSHEALEKDPNNRLLSRGPRFRMDAEMVRDAALAASGLFTPTIGGPSVRPYQPAGVWEAVAMPGSTTRDYVQDHGESLYRRSMYTFWKRAAPPASLEIFNAPSREGCTVRRERTDTPMQALVTLNDTQYMEAARALAERAIKQGGDTFESKLNFATERLIARPMKANEAKVCRATYDDLLAYYKSHPDDAKNLLAVGESKRDESIDPATHAAWTMLANQLMNLDEMLNK